MNIRKYLRDKGGIAGTWVTIILVTLFISTSSLWLFVYRTDNKILSVINLYPFDIRMHIFNQDILLKKFDTYVRLYNTKENIDVEVYKDNADTQERLKSFSFSDLKRSSQLITIALTSSSDVCFLTADVTNAYYNTDFSIENPQVTAASDKNYLLTDINQNYSYVYPGNSIQSVFPATRTNLYAVLPIECNKSAEAIDQLKTVKIYQSYKPEEQRQYYEDQLKKIQNATSVDELSKI